MPARPSLTPAQITLLAEIAAAPITMDIADLTETTRGRDLQALGQWGLIRLGEDESGEDESGQHPVRFRYSRTARSDPWHAAKDPPVT